ncbi:unnamed protein product [Euphydryas editha]|uniref:Uncharacterized protein n=1 Tax=Euphydryas editha TaxID=104508 RepID=A0AAU9UNN3_EUPED|nr:unnamed protein product [Euphydryas editha]
MYFHFNDNMSDDRDRYHKVTSFIHMIRVNYLKVEEETRFSIDEMMVAHKDDSSQAQTQVEESPTTMLTLSFSVSSEDQKSQQNIEYKFALQWSREYSKSRNINIAIGEMIVLDKQP